MATLASLKPAFGSLSYAARLEIILETRKLRRAAVQSKKAVKSKGSSKKKRAPSKVALPSLEELRANPELLKELKELLDA